MLIPLPPIIVATEIFNPPFIMQGEKGQLFGFDIEMMMYICRTIHRDCQFPLDFWKTICLWIWYRNK
ncbi:transporter substrate-binding domain-containing protein [Legionella longbeachae]|nr:transporter substrate-binding domain-containing protein [Legionella longbeachae]VEE03291.1 putative amino acid ABC transporter, periplasmic binding protein [Legionella oakridgensis]HBD7399143.1 transporter substrate-binding domain-containing protein [Legionella pneumophila]QIN33008.1 transporter substrate-binding domain-containing protein [Legionella longbeachae]QIN36308.1 transporter substrate-binding domain-containing protein [Legionella longbeachae]